MNYGCGTHHLSGIDANKMSSIVQEITGDEKEIGDGNVMAVKLEPHGEILHLLWNSETEVLQIEIVSKPWFVTCEKILKRIRKLVKPDAPDGNEKRP